MYSGNGMSPIFKACRLHCDRRNRIMPGMRRREFLQLGALAAAGGLAPSVVARAWQSPNGIGGNRLRGITIDAARLTERPEYYRRIIDFCHDWKLNTILFRLTDDQGSAFRFESHPELATHDHALSPAAARELAEYGQRRGVILIPEVESFGHTTYITSVAKFAHLADTPPGGRTGFVGLSPVNPDSLPLMRDLYSEVAKAFASSRYIHGGCDEVNWGGSELSRKALEKRSRAEIWADYLNGLDTIARELNKELIVWGDFVAHKEPEILEHLSKRVIVMDWQYYVTDPQPLADTARKIADAGIRAIGAPALISCEWGPRPGAQTLANVDAFVEAYANNDSRNLGVIVTNWIPSRYLASSLWDSFAYVAMSLSDGPDAARSMAFRRFVERFYGADWSETWKSAFADLYRITPGRTCTREWKPPRLPLPSTSDDDVKQNIAGAGLDPAPYEKVAGALRMLDRKVKRNRTEFASFSLAADYIAHVVWREQQWRGGTNFAEIARRDADILKMLEIEWNMTRFDDSRGKSEKMVGLTPYDQLILRMRQAAKYSAEKSGRT
jgi:hypothetical protein